MALTRSQTSLLLRSGKKINRPLTNASVRRKSLRNNMTRKCQKSFIIYKPTKGDCVPVIRQVLGDGKRKYIQHNGQKKNLSAIRGKYRFTDARQL